MQIIQAVRSRIDEEQHDACEYAKLALEYKEKRRSLADIFYALSQDEMRHAMSLHNEITQIIREYHEEHGDPPANMQAVYDYRHEKDIEKHEQIKRYQAMYRD